MGQISDSKSESYDFQVPVPSKAETAGVASPRPSAAEGNSSAEEHTIIVRAYDRFDNMGVSKVVVNPPAGR